jgi:hypothetical protein
VAQQRLEPAAARHHIGVEERHVLGRARGQAGVARRGRPLVASVTQDLHVAELLRKVGLL